MIGEWIIWMSKPGKKSGRPWALTLPDEKGPVGNELCARELSINVPCWSARTGRKDPPQFALCVVGRLVWVDEVGGHARIVDASE